MPLTKIYPRLSDLLSLEFIPDRWDSVREAISSVFERVYVKDLSYGHSLSGDSARYSLTLISPNSIGIELPFAEDLKVVLNPHVQGTSELDVSLSYTWEVLRYVRDFELSDFQTTMESVMFLLLDIADISEEEFIALAIETFFPGADGIQTFLSTINSYYHQADDIVYQVDATLNEDENISALLDAIDSSSLIQNSLELDDDDLELDSFKLVFRSILDNTDLEQAKANLQLLFESIFDDIDERLNEVLWPKFLVRFNELGIGLQFPRKWLAPVATEQTEINGAIYNANDPLPQGYFSYLSFDVGALQFNSEHGFKFFKEHTFNLSRSRIAKTGLIVEFTDLKVDLSSDRSIPEALNDGRTEAFKGVFIGNGVVTLPPFLNLESGSQIVTKNLLIGNEGGVSGLIGIENGSTNEHWLNFPIDDVENPTTGTPPQGMTIDLAAGTVTCTGTITLDDESKLLEKSIPFPSDGSDLYIRDASEDQRIFRITADGTFSEPGFVSDPVMNFSLGSGGSELNLNSFHVLFHQNKVVSTKITGSLHLTDIGTIDVRVEVEDGFMIHLQSSDEIPVLDNDLVSVVVNSLDLGYQSDLWKFGISCDIENRITLPILDKILPRDILIHHLNYVEGEALDFDIALEWPSGTKIGGTDEGGFNGVVPLQLNIGNTLYLDQVKLRTAEVPEGGMDIYAQFQGARLSIGPLMGQANGMGFVAELRESTGDGNFGRTQVDIHFIPPTGIGIGWESTTVVAKGFLEINYEEKQFLGALELTVIDKIDLTAVGLLDVGLPGHPDKSSFIALITTTLAKAIPVAFGFSLTEVGGLIGLNRSINQAALTEAVYTGGLDHILFPDSPVENIHTIISNLDSAFPVNIGSTTIGLMGRFVQGEATTLDIGLLVSLPAPTLLALVAALNIEMDSDGSSILEINAYFLALLNFSEKKLSVDATIIDSQIAGIVIEGDIALRYSWGQDKYFVFSVGGFHPRFTLPDNIEIVDLKRLTLRIKDSNNLRLIATTYTAVTSNTFQTGARLDFYAKLAVVKVTADFGFDALFFFDPFKFYVTVWLSAEIKAFGKSLVGISFELDVSGPKPWHLHGKGSVKILRKKISFTVNKTIGSGSPVYLDPVEIKPLILEDLSKPKAIATVGKDDLEVSLMSITEEDGVVLDPGGKLQILQNVAPFNFLINKYGDNPITSFEEEYYISQVRLNGMIADLLDATEEYFAQFQYRKGADIEKLQAESFELMDSGRNIGGASFGISIPEKNCSRAISYEIIYKARDEEEEIPLTPMNREQMDPFISGGALGKNSGSKRNKKINQRKQRARWRAADYGIVHVDNLRLKSNALKGMTKGQAEDTLRRMEQEEPSLIGRYKVSPSYEYRPATLVEAEEVRTY